MMLEEEKWFRERFSFPKNYRTEAVQLNSQTSHFSFVYVDEYYLYSYFRTLYSVPSTEQV